MLAYYFPPDSSSGSFRPLFFANHLTKMGDEIIVLTSRQEDFLVEQPLDGQLIARLDKRVKVVRSADHRPTKYLFRLRDRLTTLFGGLVSSEIPVMKGAKTATRTQAAKDFITDLLTTPDPQIGWIFSCIRQALAIIRDQRPDIILATGSPWSGLLAGSLLKWLTGVPLALDFRDPWIANPTHAQRGSLFRRIDAWLERRVVGNADLLISSTAELCQDFLTRYATLSPERVAVITNGFEDYLANSSRRTNRALTLTHTGDLYSSRNPRPLLEAARNAIKHGRIDPMEFKLRFVGGIAVDDPTITAILASPYLTNSIEVIPRVTYGEALRAICGSDVLILYQPGFPLQVPRKLYDYMAARRPVLCVAEPGSATWSLVERCLLGTVCDNDAGRLEEVLVTMYSEWQSGRLAPIISDRCEAFRNYNLTVRLRNHLEQVIQTPTDIFF